ncbi:MAG: hypothetical protein GY825_04360 [Phycisphaeraceae bacterium]|nr:hypothetical protein [Phycisphaeraceae bacterium]
MRIDEITTKTAPVTTIWVEVALVVFVTVFVLVLAWLLFTNTARWRADASIPLREDVVEPRDETENPDA